MHTILYNFHYSNNKASVSVVENTFDKHHASNITQHHSAASSRNIMPQNHAESCSRIL